MIRAYLQIENEPMQDTYDAYGFIYLSSDTRFAAPTKGFATTAYVEQAGENIDPRTVDDAFDYKIKFCIEAPNKNLLNANEKIKAFNELMYEKTDASDIKKFKTFTFHNNYKRVVVKGVPSPIAEVDEKDFFRDKFGNVHDIVVVELTLRVTNPSLCDFSISHQDI